MAKAIADFLFGLFFGLGLLIAYALLQLIRWFLANAGHMGPP